MKFTKENIVGVSFSTGTYFKKEYLITKINDDGVNCTINYGADNSNKGTANNSFTLADALKKLNNGDWMGELKKAEIINDYLIY